MLNVELIVLNVDFVGRKPEPHAVVRKFCPTRPERAEAPSPGRALKKSLHGLC